MLRNLAIGLALLIGAAVLLGAAIGRLLPSVRVASLDTSALPEGWRPVDWPLIKDQFDSGLAIECMGSGCANFSAVTVRAKIGFCNCATGVSDDEELERIGDLHLVAAASTAVHEGSEIVVGRMKGRSRPYRVAGQPSVYSIAFNDRCDVIVATAAPQDARVELDGIEPSALSFLNSETVTHWAERAIGF